MLGEENWISEIKWNYRWIIQETRKAWLDYFLSPRTPYIVIVSDNLWGLIHMPFSSPIFKCVGLGYTVGHVIKEL